MWFHVVPLVVVLLHVKIEESPKRLNRLFWCSWSKTTPVMLRVCVSVCGCMYSESCPRVLRDVGISGTSTSHHRLSHSSWLSPWFPGGLLTSGGWLGGNFFFFFVVYFLFPSLEGSSVCSITHTSWRNSILPKKVATETLELHHYLAPKDREESFSSLHKKSFFFFYKVLVAVLLGWQSAN